MLHNSVRQPREAILVMDSRKTPSAVRSQNFAGAWTQLYKAGDHFLDLGVRQAEPGFAVQGMLIGEPGRLAEGGSVRVVGPQGVAEAQFGGARSFRLELAQPGTYTLEIALSDETIAVSGLEIS